MAQDKLQVGLEYDVKGVALAKLEKSIDKSIYKTKVHERSASMTSSKLNIKKTKKRLKRLQKQVSRKYENNKEGNRYHKTANIVKLERKIRLLHRRLANIRLNYNHQITTEIVKTKPSQIVTEDLNIKGMMSCCLKMIRILRLISLLLLRSEMHIILDI